MTNSSESSTFLVHPYQNINKRNKILELVRNSSKNSSSTSISIPKQRVQILQSTRTSMLWYGSMPFIAIPINKGGF